MANPVVRSSLTLEVNPNGTVALPASSVNFASSRTSATIVQEGYAYTTTSFVALPGPTPTGIYEITVVNLSAQTVQLRLQNSAAANCDLQLPAVDTTTGAIYGLVHLRLAGGADSGTQLSADSLPLISSTTAGAQVYYRIALV